MPPLSGSSPPNITSPPVGHNRSGSGPRIPTRAQLGAAEPFKPGGPTKVDLLTLDLGDGPMVIKDFGRKAWWVRLIGRVQIRREWQAYRWLGSVPGIPGLIGRIDPYALAVEKIDGQPLGLSQDRFSREGGQCFLRLQAILERLHATGLVHWDLRAQDNVIIRPDGELYVVDLAAAFRLRPGGLPHRLLFGLLTGPDRSALLKWKKRLKAGPYTEEEQAFLRRHRLLRDLWIFNRRHRKHRQEAD